MSKQLVSQDLSQIILTIRGQRVILDKDLAALYGVPTGRLNEAVKRNQERFPSSFMFTLDKNEGEKAMRLRSQIAILKRGHHLKYLPKAFTEHGALMVANILNSATAIKMSVTLVEEFIRLRQMLVSIDELSKKVKSLEKGFHEHGQQFQLVFEAIQELMTPPPDAPRKKIGFHPNSPKASPRGSILDFQFTTPSKVS
jgi:phage regulator Rha-like protein